MKIHCSRCGRFLVTFLVLLALFTFLFSYSVTNHNIAVISGINVGKQSIGSTANIRHVKVNSPQMDYYYNITRLEGLAKENNGLSESTQDNKKRKTDMPARTNDFQSRTQRDSHKFTSLDAQKTIYFYSAHFDIYQKRIKVVGLGPMSDTLDLSYYKCLYQDHTGSAVSSPLGVYYRLSTYYPWEGQEYDSYFFTCGRAAGPPATVTITNSQSGTSYQFPIEPSWQETANSKRFKFGVCVEPLVEGYNDIDSLRHFIAANTVFGAEHFYFYFTDASPEVRQFLDSIEQVTVYEFPLGDLLHKTHAYAQKAANSHCLYAHKYITTYLAFIDIDEVLVPRADKSWNEMMNGVKRHNPNTGAVIFSSQLFPCNIPSKLADNPEDSFIKSHKLWSITNRQALGVFELYRWSKVLLETSKTDIMDIHNIRQLYPAFTSVNASYQLGLIHHYREFEASPDSAYADDYLLTVKNTLIYYYKALFNLEP